MVKNIDDDSRQNRSADDEGASGESDQKWLSLARDAFQTSTSFLDGNLRKQLDRNLRNFQSRHPTGSKYNSDDYKGRSALFRPKTRSAIRKAESAAATAFFSTADVVNIQAMDDSDDAKRMSGKILHELVNWRLQNSIKWFLTCLGAFQDAKVAGVCISYHDWEFEEEVEIIEQPAIDPYTGSPMIDDFGEVMVEEVENRITLRDAPDIELVPVENFRIDRGADWRDPINSSPYVIQMMSMYIGDVKDRIEAIDSKTGAPKWLDVGETAIKAARADYYDSTQRVREGDRQVPQEASNSDSDFDMVWVHRNIIRKGGEDWVYYTLGTEGLLTNPVRVREAYPHLPRGKRPYAMGYATVETHKTYPASTTQLGESLQTEINEVTNQRLDNVRLAVNGRYKVKRGKKVDLANLLKSVPGGAFFVENMDDVEHDRAPDVTSSSYQEQDRLSVEFDEVAGGFSQSSVQANRSLNETVGGMKLLSGSANATAEYELRVFSETWVEEVIRQMVWLERHYETDDVVLAVCGQKAGLPDDIARMPELLMHHLQEEVTVSVNVGIGSTDPMQQLEKFERVLGGIAKLGGPAIVSKMDVEAVIEEAFGKAGYKDGRRFFKFGEDGVVLEMAQKKIKELEQEVEEQRAVAQMEQQGKENIARMGAEADIAVQQLRNTGAIQKVEAEQRKSLAESMMEMESQIYAQQMAAQQQPQGYGYV